MKLRIWIVGALLLTGACAHQPAETPAQTVDRMLRLFADDRNRYVINLQDMQQKKIPCDDIGAAAALAEKMDHNGSAPKEQQENLVKVKMDLASAEKTCRE